MKPNTKDLWKHDENKCTMAENCSAENDSEMLFSKIQENILLANTCQDFQNLYTWFHQLYLERNLLFSLQTKSQNDFMEQFFLPLPQPSQSGWESLQSILWMYLSWLIGIYTLEKLTSGWSPSASSLLGRSHIIGLAGPAVVFEFLGGCLTGKWDKRRPFALCRLEACSSEGPF